MDLQNRFALVVLLAGALAACSGGGAPTVQSPVTSAPPVASYTGPAPATGDVQAFKINLWENVKASNRCGGCHNATGQAPRFARNDDVNLAYQEATALVSLTQPDQSRLVAKVAGGHNCWLQANSACGDTMTVWIRNWAGSLAGGGRTIPLQAPALVDVGASRSFPRSPALFQSTVYPLVRQHCVRCHAPTAATPQSPFFASGDLDEAYAAVREKINLDDPSRSRLVVRLRDEFHNCWADCATAASAMLNAVTSLAQGIPLTAVDPTLLASKALRLYDGTVAAGGNRYDAAVVALYEFKTGRGTVAYDTSGVEPAANLTLSGSVEWMGGWGINLGAGGRAQAPTAASRKLADMIKSTGEFSLEAWAAPANVVQTNAWIVSYSGGTGARNATLAQRAFQYEMLARSNRTDASGAPSLLTNAQDRDAQAALQHIVLTYDPVNGRRLYVNGNDTGDRDPQGGGSLADWDDSFALVLGNETSGNRSWQGALRLVAVHNRALTAAQVQQNFAAGVGERYFLLFSVAHLVDVPQSYVMFEASQYDSYSYLFQKPTFISLDPNAAPADLAIQGLRIGVNGTEVRVGQAYVPLDLRVGGSGYSPGSGQLLSRMGTVIGLEKGADADQFFLTFERIGGRSRSYEEEPLPAPATPPDAPPEPEVGLRTFDEINASFAQITGVPVTNAAVAQTFAQVRQTLPAIEQIGTFGSSAQTGIAQLAIRYCAALVDDAGLRGGFFPGLDLGAQAAVFFGASGSANRNLLIDPLWNRAVGAGLAAQPAESDVRQELDDLITRLTAGAAGSAPGRTAIVTKAVCAAALGSAATIVQ
ncbi:MAG: LamG domain-containing protein [Gammaproteobacteria bacterium]|nr:LamG domain-containing protein [Gammaproteobacteria bacterium]